MRFVSINRDLCRRIAVRWPRRTGWRRTPPNEYLSRIVLLAPAGGLITDIGAGKRTAFYGAIADRDCLVLGVDVSPDDLQLNPGLDARVVRDVAADGLPPEADGSGLICSHFVLEHLPDIQFLADESYRALRPGGFTVHRFAGRWSLFALANRLLPPGIARQALFTLNPAAREIGGFHTYYDRTDPRAARLVFQRAGFTDVHTAVSWEMAEYFGWFVPAYLMARLLERFYEVLRLETFASYVVLSARKPEDAR